MIHRALIIIYTLVFCAACVTDQATSGGTDERNDMQFLEQSAIGIYQNNEAIKLYDEKSEQIIYDDQKSFYMVTDLNCDKYYSLAITGDVVLNGEVSVEYINNNIKKLSSDIITMEVIKINPHKKAYWLWNSKLEVGFIIDFDIQ